MKISALVLTHENQEILERCLKSVSWCAEVVVVDDFSTDNTHKIANKLGARVYKRHLNNNFAAQRNFALTKAKSEWVLFIDSDEVVSPQLRIEIEKLAEKSFDEIGFYIRRQDIIWGKKLIGGESGTISLLRLAKKSSGLWKRKVHEFWDVDGKTKALKGEILHFTHPSLREFISHVNFHSTLHAKENMREEKKSSVVKIIMFPVLKFLDNYIFKFGFLDGVAGFVAAAIMSWHSYLSWSKMYIWQKN